MGAHAGDADHERSCARARVPERPICRHRRPPSAAAAAEADRTEPHPTAVGVLTTIGMLIVSLVMLRGFPQMVATY
jgi:hypothetical protein